MLGIDCAHPEDSPISRLAANRGFLILCPDKTRTKMALLQLTGCGGELLWHLKKLYESMPRRMKAVIDVGGGHTKY